ncbi:hypothetical protein [Streptomyces cahuitamycinicus]|nr:hypothetical protein [Streptomyces cahuitamycinicus]
MFFGASALLGLLGLCALALHDVPKISGTVAFILTCAALAVAVLR